MRGEAGSRRMYTQNSAYPSSLTQPRMWPQTKRKQRPKCRTKYLFCSCSFDKHPPLGSRLPIMVLPVGLKSVYLMVLNWGVILPHTEHLAMSGDTFSCWAGEGIATIMGTRDAANNGLFPTTKNHPIQHVSGADLRNLVHRGQNHDRPSRQLVCESWVFWTFP